MTTALKTFHRRISRAWKCQGEDRVNEMLNTVRYYAPLIPAVNHLLAEAEQEAYKITDERTRLKTLRTVARVAWQVNHEQAAKLMGQIDALEQQEWDK